MNNGLRLNIPLHGKPKLVRRVALSQFWQSSGVVRRQADAAFIHVSSELAFILNSARLLPTHSTGEKRS
jgi:hypothetical protein